MGLSDTTQKSTQSGTAMGKSSTRVPDTPDIIAARTNRAQIDPSIGARLGEKERQLASTFNNPTGGYVTPQIRDAVMRSGQRELMQQAGEQAREGQFDVNRLNQSKDLALAGLTRGEDTTNQQDYSNQGKVVQSQSPWGTIAGIGAQFGQLSL